MPLSIWGTPALQSWLLCTFLRCFFNPDVVLILLILCLCQSQGAVAGLGSVRSSCQAEKSVLKALTGWCWVWAQQLIGDEAAPAEHLPVWCGSPLKYMKNTKWSGHYHLEKAQVQAWLVFRVGFSHLLTTVMHILLMELRNSNKGLFVFAVSFPFFYHFYYPSIPLCCSWN